jgi:prepilin-type N-terminal cleavage/methylation domain-containing protein
MSTANKINQQKGFTIIELMIATSVFATILLMVSVMIIGISRLYYKGINQSRVQAATRQIAEQVSQSLQYTGGVWVPGTSKPFTTVNGGVTQSITAEAYCMGNIRYSFVRGVQSGDGPGESRHALWRDTNDDDLTCEPVDLTNPNIKSISPEGQEMIMRGGRVTELKIDGAASPFIITVAVAYGDDTTDNDGPLELAVPPAPPEDARCRGGNATQFCATAKLKTAAVRRLP